MKCPTAGLRFPLFLLCLGLCLAGSVPLEAQSAQGHRVDPVEIQRTPPRTRIDPSWDRQPGSGLFEHDPDRELEGDQSGQQGEGEVPILPEACESELALSAAPEHLREAAGLFVLRREGYERIRDSSNGFDCIVNRDHPKVIKPTCFDAEGAATIVPKIVDVGQWLLEGLEPTEIQQRIEHGFVTGRYTSPARPGMAYMLSNYNRPWFPRSGTLGHFPPHLMFYAPNLTSQDIGFDPEAFRGDRSLPLIGYQGPHGFIIVITGENRERERGELRTCPNWVWE